MYLIINRQRGDQNHDAIASKEYFEIKAAYTDPADITHRASHAHNKGFHLVLRMSQLGPYSILPHDNGTHDAVFGRAKEFGL